MVDLEKLASRYVTSDMDKFMTTAIKGGELGTVAAGVAAHAHFQSYLWWFSSNYHMFEPRGGSRLGSAFYLGLAEPIRDPLAIKDTKFNWSNVDYGELYYLLETSLTVKELLYLQVRLLTLHDNQELRKIGFWAVKNIKDWSIHSNEILKDIIRICGELGADIMPGYGKRLIWKLSKMDPEGLRRLLISHLILIAPLPEDIDAEVFQYLPIKSRR